MRSRRVRIQLRRREMKPRRRRPQQRVRDLEAFGMVRLSAVDIRAYVVWV